MKTYWQPGEIIELTAPSGGVVSGTVYKIGDLVVAATVTAAQTEKFNALTRGVITYAKVNAQAWAEAVKVYWDDSAKNFTTTSAGNTLVGVAAEAAANPTATGKIRLDGVAR